MIKLHDYWRSSASYRTRIALGLTGEPWQSVPVDLVAGAQRSEEHLALNPQGLVPVLEIDGLTLTQSVAQIEYLDETRELNLLPKDIAERAKVRALVYAIAMDVHPVCNLRVARWASEMSQGGITMESWMQHFIAGGLAAFEKMVGADGYCFGATLTLADLCLMPQIYNAHRWGISLETTPKIRRIEETLAQIPAFQAAHPDRHKPGP